MLSHYESTVSDGTLGPTQISLKFHDMAGVPIKLLRDKATQTDPGGQEGASTPTVSTLDTFDPRGRAGAFNDTRRSTIRDSKSGPLSAIESIVDQFTDLRADERIFLRLPLRDRLCSRLKATPIPPGPPSAGTLEECIICADVHPGVRHYRCPLLVDIKSGAENLPSAICPLCLDPKSGHTPGRPCHIIQNPHKPDRSVICRLHNTMHYAICRGCYILQAESAKKHLRALQNKNERIRLESLHSGNARPQATPAVLSTLESIDSSLDYLCDHLSCPLCDAVCHDPIRNPGGECCCLRHKCPKCGMEDICDRYTSAPSARTKADLIRRDHPHLF